MKRLLACAVAALVLVTAAVFSHTRPSGPAAPAISSELKLKVEERNPWNHLRLNNDPSVFRFAIVTDRTGGARPGVFERAVEQLNWLQPEFVVSVGDLIQGGSADLKKVNTQWDQFNGFIAKLEMPFFYVPGNHDISNKVMDLRWGEMFGRRYYHFVYKNVLFLLLNTEDPPGIGSGKFSPGQLTYIKKTLDENAGVRWILVFLHKPVWTYPNMEKTNWPEVEKLLAGRRYTVFAGHKHRYERFVRQGQKYYMLATTGGSSKLRGAPLGEFDHLIWVTMKQDGPVIANLMMEGIFPEDVKAAQVEKGLKAP
ncbi:MAG: metallophosphoesterase [Gemmataceae bacterium]|nr:metallophosphoesterase [Gemmataceae bacterium]